MFRCELWETKTFAEVFMNLSYHFFLHRFRGNLGPQDFGCHFTNKISYTNILWKCSLVGTVVINRQSSTKWTCKSGRGSLTFTNVCLIFITMFVTTTTAAFWLMVQVNVFYIATAYETIATIPQLTARRVSHLTTATSQLMTSIIVF